MNFENDFIIGLDLGNLTTTLSYFNFNQKSLDLVDISGGYGKVSVPTIASYNNLSGDWIFGEYALLNKDIDDNIAVDNMVENLGKNVHYNINYNSVSLVFILSKFLIFLIDSIKNINPNAELKGIVLSTNCDNSEVKSDIKKAFKLAHMENLLLNIADDNSCILKNFFYKNGMKKGKTLLIDYGNRELRASLYEIEESIVCIKSDSDKSVGERNIFEATKDLIISKFLEETNKKTLTEYEKNSIDIFTYQQFDTIFQKKEVENMKIYYNFYYPPFQKLILKDEILSIIYLFEKKMYKFFEKFFKNEKIKKSDIENVILSGGGLEISFVYDFLQNKFSLKKDYKKLFKRAISDGACVKACEILGILPRNDICIEDVNKVDYSIGLFIKNGSKDEFYPLVYKNDFIWQQYDEKVFNIADKLDVDGVDFSLFVEKDKKIKMIKEIKINLEKYYQFANRDIKTIRISTHIKFEDKNRIVFTIKDYGFGEICKKTDFKEEIVIKLNE